MKTAAALKLANWASKDAIKRAWFDHFGPICLFCDRKMEFSRRFRNATTYATIDHINAQGLGGNNAHSNLQVICRRCNQEKAEAEQDAAAFMGRRPPRMRMMDKRTKAMMRAEMEILRNPR